MRPLSAFLATIITAFLVLSVTSQASQAQSSSGAYRVSPGDVLRIEVLEDPSLNRDALVSPDGRLSMALAGSVQASGRTLEDIQANLSQRLAPNFATSPNVFVSLTRLADRVKSTGSGKGLAIDIYLLGEVAKPGRIEVKPGTTIMQLFAEMGGFSKFAATKRIQLRRPAGGGEKIMTFNYDAMQQGTSNAGSTIVRDGDIILVPQRRLFEFN